MVRKTPMPADSSPSPAAGRRRRLRRRGLWGLLLLIPAGLLSPGCINVLAMGAKVFLGDPKVPATFKERTGIDLEKGQHTVALVVDAPYSLSREFDTLLIDLQDELLRRLKRKGVPVARVDDVGEALDASGGDFNPAAIARALDVDVIIHVQMEQFTDVEDGNPSLFRGHAQGLVRGFKVTGIRGESNRAVIEVYEEGFTTSYPSGHPIPADQVTHRVFTQGFVRELSHQIGRQFYDVYTRDLF